MKYQLDWLELTSGRKMANMQSYILDTYGKLSESEYKDAFIVIDKCYRTWDDKVAFCTSGDRQYAPAVFVWYYKNKLNGKSSTPIVIMREVYNSLKCTCLT